MSAPQRYRCTLDALYTGLHPVLRYVALSGLALSTNSNTNTGLHPVLTYVALSGLALTTISN